MAITYKIRGRRDPRNYNKEGSAKFYAQIVSNQQIQIEDMARNIARRITAQEADVQAVLVALGPVMRELLLNSYVVQLSQLGRFRVSFNGLGADSEEKYDTGYITRIKNVFTPTKAIKQEFSLDVGNLEFVRAKGEYISGQDKDKKPAAETMSAKVASETKKTTRKKTEKTPAK